VHISNTESALMINLIGNPAFKNEIQLHIRTVLNLKYKGENK